ncbi:MAG TPA: PDZ domain-containing protein [Steroidobacteraceae bacterium]|nr:PDZ domain-containing protein [Steroidobacteraceae bacterium]
MSRTLPLHWALVAVTMSIVLAGCNQELSWPGEFVAAQTSEESPGLGLDVWPLTAEERKALATDGTLIVAEAAGRAAAAGIEVGDVILAVNGKPVRSAAELRTAVEQAGKVVAFLIQREDAQILVPIP